MVHRLALSFCMNKSLDTPLPPDQVAKLARLRYVNDGEPGYSRKRKGRGFMYVDEEGVPVKDKALHGRFAALVIPPAWTDVWICARPNGHIQATGRDEKGRKQYIYHTRWGQVRNEAKFHHLCAFGEALPALRTQVEQHLRLRQLSREKVVALVVRLLDATLLRIGNMAYANENESYGLTTLQDEHTAVSGSTITFYFRGKSGKQQQVTLQDRRLARLVKQCQDLPGQDLFQYTADDGTYHTITSTDVNDYLHRHMGQAFTAKEFRTWGATVVAAETLATLGAAETEQEGKKNVVTAVKQAAQALGNTPTVCRQYYIHPAIFEAYLNGNLLTAVTAAQSGKMKSKEGLTAMETAVLSLLQS
jgi:DNA topoisomerase-1